MILEFKKKLEADIEIIISTIHKFANSKIVSIILYGSYGRDEGAFYYDNNSEIHSYNDYDLLLIVNDSVSEFIVQEIKQSLLAKLDVRWIDISQSTLRSLRKLKPTIFNFDLKYGSKIIDGDSSVLNLIPSFKADQITLKDAETLYFTRLYTFLGSLPPNAFNVGIEGDDSRFFRNQMAKAVLAIVDVLLLQEKMYHTSYQERVKRLGKLYPFKRELIELSNWALNEKMTPLAPDMNPKETKDLHSKVLRIYHKEMHIALSKYYAKKIVNTDDLRKAKGMSFQELILKIKILIMTKTLRHYNKQNNILFAQCYAVESFIKRGEERNIIYNKCKTLVSKIDSTLNTEYLNGDDLNKLILKLSR